MALWVYDPGKTTGYAKFDPQGKLEDYGEFSLWKKIEDQIQDDDTIIYEDIKIRHLAFDPIGLQVIGVIRYIVGKRSRVILTSQPPSIIYGVSKWPIYNLTKIRSVHARDAVCHGIVALGKEKVLLPSELYSKLQK